MKKKLKWTRAEVWIRYASEEVDMSVGTDKPIIRGRLLVFGRGWTYAEARKNAKKHFVLREANYNDEMVAIRKAQGI